MKIGHTHVKVTFMLRKHSITQLNNNIVVEYAVWKLARNAFHALYSTVCFIFTNVSFFLLLQVSKARMTETLKPSCKL